MSATPAQDLVITLVHGTWGRGIFWLDPVADWARDDAALATRLREAFGPQTVIRAFAWSGGNRHAARRRAAEALAADLTAALDQHPDARHVVIAHSHGGNVALMALAREPVLADRLAGLCCLATPVIVARQRDLGVTSVRPLASAVVLLSIALTVWFQQAWLPQLTGWVRISGLLIGLLPLLLGLAALVMSRSAADRLLAELNVAPNGRMPLLILRSPGDEASGAIAWFQFLSQLSVGLLHTLTRAQAWLMRHLVDPYLRSERSREMLGSALLFVPALLWLPVAMFVALLMLVPFGWQAAAANLLLDISAEATPMGTHRVQLVAPATHEESGSAAPPQAHAVHGNPNAHRAIVEWLAAMR
jgi:pimeloyl-ACP methyl ester carboxylesterase